MLKKQIIRILFLGLLGCPMFVGAQVNPDEIALKNDEFENHFYESLKQKAIENYDKAIAEMQQCIAIQPKNAALYNELGKIFFP